jgi:hypothetical protein
MSDTELSLMMIGGVVDLEGSADLGLEEVGGCLSSYDELVEILGIREGEPQTPVAQVQTWRHTFDTEDKWPI